MSNVFIAWNDLKLAEKVKRELEKNHPEDSFIIGTQTQAIRHLGTAAMEEIKQSEYAIILISKSNKVVKNGNDEEIFFSPNVFFELGYCSALMRSENVLIFTIGIRPEDLPVDIKGNRVNPITGSLANAAGKIVKIFGSKIENKKSPEDIFNDWPSIKKQLTDIAPAISEKQKAEHILHSIQSSLYYGELSRLCGVTKDIGTSDPELLAVKSIINLVERHYDNVKYSDDLDVLEYDGSNPWIKIIGNDYIALRYKKQYRDTSEVRYLDSSERCIKTAIEEIGAEGDGFYTQIWKSYLYYNYARICELFKDRIDETKEYYRRAVECNAKALRGYHGSLRSSDCQSVIMLSLEQESLLRKVDFLKYRYNIKEMTEEETKKELNVLEDNKKEIEEGLKKREYVWDRLEQQIEYLVKQL